MTARSSRGRLRRSGTRIGGYIDSAIGTPLRTWEAATAAMDTDPEAEPAHKVQFGWNTDVQGVLAGTKRASGCLELGYALGTGGRERRSAPVAAGQIHTLSVF